MRAVALVARCAQARTAPIQRLADSVAGKFAYGIMALSAATLAFWTTAGTKLFPQVSEPAPGPGRPVRMGRARRSH